MINLPESRLEQIAIEIDTAIDNLGPLLREARNECQREGLSFRDWCEARGLSRASVYRAMNEDPEKYQDNRVSLRDTPQDDPVDPEPTYIPEHEPPDPPIDPVEGQPKVGNDWSGTVDPSPPKDTLVPRIEALAGQCSGEQLEAATTALIMLCKDTGRWKITKLGKGAFRVDKVPEVQYDPTKSELNHTQFPQHGERRYVPK